MTRRYGGMAAADGPAKEAKMPDLPQKILFVLTSNAKMNTPDEKTGLWLSEFTEPYYLLQDNGFALDVVSVKGGPVPLDPRSTTDVEMQKEPGRRYLADETLRNRLHFTQAVTDIDFRDYDAIFIPGGHGTMWDMPQSVQLGQLISGALQAGKPVAAVCHGPAALLSAQAPDGRPLVAGRNVTAFTTAEEKAVGLEQKVPFLLDERLRELGALFQHGEPFQDYTVVDGNLITGQNPQSALSAAERLMHILAAKATQAQGQAAR